MTQILYYVIYYLLHILASWSYFSANCRSGASIWTELSPIKIVVFKSAMLLIKRKYNTILHTLFDVLNLAKCAEKCFCKAFCCEKHYVSVRKQYNTHRHIMCIYIYIYIYIYIRERDLMLKRISLKTPPYIALFVYCS